MTVKIALAVAAIALGASAAEAASSLVTANEQLVELGSRWRDYNYVPWQCYTTLPRPRYCR